MPITQQSIRDDAERFKAQIRSGIKPAGRQRSALQKPPAKRVGDELQSLLVHRHKATCTRCFTQALRELNAMSASEARSKRDTYVPMLWENFANAAKENRAWAKAVIEQHPKMSDPFYGELFDEACDACEPAGLAVASGSAYRMMRSRTIGEGYHRHGWPYAVETLMSGQSASGILVEDFAESRFAYTPESWPILESWIGIFHHPPDPPEFVPERAKIENYTLTDTFQKSLPFLRGAIALSEHLAKDLRRRWPGVPVDVVLMPFPNEPTFSMDLFLSGKKRLAQIGWYQRNTQAIYQVPSVKNWTKIRLLQNTRRAWDQMVKEKSPWRERTIYSQTVTERGYIPNNEYDELLRSSVVMTEAFAASACCGVGDCISTATPILCNRLPSFVEYLGEDYPGFIDSPLEIPDFLTDDHVERMHNYLLTMDRSWMTRAKLVEAVERLATKAQPK